MAELTLGTMHEGAGAPAGELEQLAKLNQDLRKSFDEIMSALTNLSDAISLKFDTTTLLNLLSDLVVDVVPYRAAAILLYSPESGYRTAVGRGLSPEIQRKFDGVVEEGLIDWAVRSRKSIVMPDAETAERPTSFVISPLLAQESLLGSILLHVERGAEEFSANDLVILNILSSQSAIAIQNSLLYGDMESKNRDLARLKNYLDNVIDHVSNGLIAIDREGRITTFNERAADLFGKAGAEVVGRNYRGLFDPRAVSALDGFAAAIEIGEVGGDVECDLPRDGRTISLRLSPSVLRDDAGRPVGVVVMVQDLTESKEIVRLRELDKLKNELVANVSHELRTPLTSIKAYAETLLDMAGSNDPDTEREFLGIICGESERLTNLISNMLDLSRMESGDFRLKLARVDLVETVRKCATLVNELAAQKGIAIDFASSAASAPCTVDEGKIEQVFINLLSNAIKYNRPSGTVTARVEQPDAEHVEVSVTDTGIGIPADALPHVFEKFYRVDSTLTYEVSGTGLGLAIVKHIVERHRGTIRVESTENEGSRFIVRLPRHGGDA